MEINLSESLTYLEGSFIDIIRQALIWEADIKNIIEEETKE